MTASFAIASESAKTDTTGTPADSYLDGLAILACKRPITGMTIRDFSTGHDEFL